MGYILKVELTELADGLDMECERKERVRINPRLWPEHLGK